MSLNVNGSYINLISPATLSGGRYAWPLEIVLRTLQVAGIIDVEFIDHGASKAAISTSKLIHEASETPKDAPGEVFIYDTATSDWVAATQELFAELLSDAGQVQANWDEADANLSSYIANRPAEMSASDFRAATADRIMMVGAYYSARSRVSLDIDSSTVTPNLAEGINFTVTLDENVELANMQNKTVGKEGYIDFVQDATGSRLLSSLGSDYVTLGGATLTLTTTANATDSIKYKIVASDEVRLTLEEDWS